MTADAVCDGCFLKIAHKAELIHNTHEVHRNSLGVCGSDLEVAGVVDPDGTHTRADDYDMNINTIA